MCVIGWMGRGHRWGNVCLAKDKDFSIAVSPTFRHVDYSVVVTAILPSATLFSLCESVCISMLRSFGENEQLKTLTAAETIAKLAAQLDQLLCKTDCSYICTHGLERDIKDRRKGFKQPIIEIWYVLFCFVLFLIRPDLWFCICSFYIPL